MNNPAAKRGTFSDWAKVLALLLVGAVLALGRFNWAANSALALRSWTMSGFFSGLLLIGTYAMARAFALTSRRGFWPLLTAASVLLNLPHRWLGLTKFFYLSKYPLVYRLTKEWLPEWLGQVRPATPWNSTDAIYLILLATTGLTWLGVVFRRRKLQASRPPGAATGKLAGFFLLLFAVMTVESWMHLSNRSPYSYIPHYEQPASANHLYNYEMLPDGRGIVNADFGYFVRLEELFQGNGAEPPMLLIRRAFPFYLSVHLSYFLGSYHAFLILNLLLWLGAAAAIYFFCRDLTKSNMVAAIAAGLVACAPGFIMYATQPMSYLPGYAILAVTIFLYHRLVTVTRLTGVPAILAMGILIGLTGLTYDNFAWVLFFTAYALLHRVSVLRIVAGLVIAAAIYAGFLLLIFQVFKLPPERSNDQHMGAAIQQVYELFRHPEFARIAPLAKSYLGIYFTQVLQVNFYLPVGLAACGLFCATNRLRLCAVTLLLPSLGTFFFMHFGGSYLASLSRFNYPCYPAIILLAAVAVGRGVDYWLARGQRVAAGLTAGLPIAAVAVLGNIDAFGFLPQLYYHFYWQTGGSFN